MGDGLLLIISTLLTNRVECMQLCFCNAVFSGGANLKYNKNTLRLRGPRPSRKMHIERSVATARLNMDFRPLWCELCRCPATAWATGAPLALAVIRALMDDFGKRSWSLAMVFPKMGKPQSPHMPAFMRIVDRGSPAAARSDISAMELFAASNVGSDPFAVAETMRASVRRQLLLHKHVQQQGLPPRVLSR